MMSNNDYVKIGYSDYGDIFLKRNQGRLMIKRYVPLEYQYMEDYINDNCDLLSEWQEDVYHGNTEEGYDEWRENYEYRYEDYFTYDSDTEEYYDEDNSDTTRDYIYVDNLSKEQVIDRVMDCFYENYQYGNFEWADMSDDMMRDTVAKYYDDCLQFKKELEESRKPHWNVFSYYK